MTVFNVLSLLGGLAIFLFGMNVMGDALEKSSAGKLKSILENLTSNPIKAVLLGAGVTAIIQSSSATTVMVVGFVNSGIMKLSQSVGIIMGANVGTTITAWILSLTGIESDNIIISLFKPVNLSLLMAFAGIIPVMFSKSSKKKDLGTIFLGLAVLLVGMDMMSAAVEPLAELDGFKNMFLLFSNPVLGVIAGAVLTGIIQSSSASVGILQALSTTGSVTYGSAIPIILGQNIGTCVTAIISSIGANKNAKRSAVIHLSFNIIGTLAFFILYYTVDMFVDFTFKSIAITPAAIAIVHTIFNVFSTAVMLPFGKQLEKLAYVIVRDKQIPEKTQLLDERLLNTPAIAIGECKKVANNMAHLAEESLFKAIDMLENYTEKDEEEVKEAESRIDSYEDKLGSYLVKVSQRNLSSEDSHEISNMLLIIGDLERIGDHAEDIAMTAKEIYEKGIVFSPAAKNEITVATNALREIIKNTMDAFVSENIEAAKGIEPLEQVIDKIKRTLKTRHIERLQKGECTIEIGFVFSDILASIERIADHCSNIAVCMIQVADDSFKTHEYLHSVKSGEDKFNQMYRLYEEKYDV